MSVLDFMEPRYGAEHRKPLMTLFFHLALCAALPTTAGDVDAYLQRLHAAHVTFEACLQQTAVDSLGLRYVDGPLGEGPGGEYDKDPLINLAAEDCVTFVEQSIALAASTDYMQTLSTLQKIRYADGVIGYETRNHFFVTDWIRNNTFCKNVTGALGGTTERVTRTIDRREFFVRMKAPALGRTTPSQSVTLEYLPVSQASAVEPQLPSPALIVFIGKIEWLFALHCGLYLRDEGEPGLLYHASSKAGAVASTPLPRYLAENSTRYLGFTVYRIGNPKTP